MGFGNISLRGISKVGQKAKAQKAAKSKPKPPPPKPNRQVGAPAYNTNWQRAQDPGFKLQGAKKPIAQKPLAKKVLKNTKPVIKSKPKGKVPKPKFTG